MSKFKTGDKVKVVMDGYSNKESIIIEHHPSYPDTYRINYDGYWFPEESLELIEPLLTEREIQDGEGLINSIINNKYKHNGSK